MDIGLNDALLVFGSLAPQLNYTAIGIVGICGYADSRKRLNYL